MKASDIARIIVQRSSRFSLRGSNVLLLAENISWGLFGWGEVDLLVCSKSMYLTDIEVKVSISDLRADFRKRKWSSDAFKRDIKYHYYAVPEEISDRAIKIIEESRPNSGIIVVKKDEGLRKGDFYYESCYVEKKAKANKLAQPLPGKNIINLARLAMFRYWRDK